MQNWNVIRTELETLLGKEILMDGYHPNSKITKIVCVSTNKNEDNFYIGILPIDGNYESSTVLEGTKNEDWFKYLPEYANTGIFWIDKDMVENIKDLKYLKQRFGL